MCYVQDNESQHYCFVCKKPTHATCQFLESAKEEFGSLVLCKICYNENPSFSQFTEDQVNSYSNNACAEPTEQSQPLPKLAKIRKIEQKVQNKPGQKTSLGKKQSTQTKLADFDHVKVNSVSIVCKNFFSLILKVSL